MRKPGPQSVKVWLDLQTGTPHLRPSPGKHWLPHNYWVVSFTAFPIQMGRDGREPPPPNVRKIKVGENAPHSPPQTRATKGTAYFLEAGGKGGRFLPYCCLPPLGGKKHTETL